MRNGFDGLATLVRNIPLPENPYMGITECIHS
jgi:hypothetical protein